MSMEYDRRIVPADRKGFCRLTKPAQRNNVRNIDQYKSKAQHSSHKIKGAIQQIKIISDPGRNHGGIQIWIVHDFCQHPVFDNRKAKGVGHIV